MKTLYLDCSMGAAGDMLTAALFELLPNKEDVLHELNRLEIPGVTFSVEKSEKCGIRGTHIIVKVNGEEETEKIVIYRKQYLHMYSEVQRQRLKCVLASQKQFSKSLVLFL